MSKYSDTINNLINKFEYKYYLEIGVKKGQTFLNIKIDHRTAVDPNFLFNYKNDINSLYFKMTSDDFFTSLKNREKEWYGKKIKYDLIFIDGLHTFSQVYQDFKNSLQYITDKSLIIIDDTFPSDPYSCIDDQQKSYKYRRMAGIKGLQWHGDVYKIVFTIHDFYKYFSYATVINHGNPYTIIWKTKIASERENLYYNISDINNMSYFSLLDYYYLLNPITIDELDNVIFTESNPVLRNTKIKLDKIITPINQIC